MPTVHPRVTVTLSPSLSDLVSALARSQRVSRSQVLRELLEAAEPGLQRVVKMMEAAENRGGAVKKRDEVHRMAEANKAFAHFRF